MLLGCGYPEFEFQGAEAAVDSGEPEAAIDTAIEDTFVEVAVDSGSDSAMDSADAMEVAAPLPVSCAEIKAKDSKVASGSFLVDPDGDGPRTPFDVFCEMSADGGGWTMVAKLDGTKSTWAYESSRWTDDTTFNTSSTSLSFSEAKFRSFNEMPLKELRVRMHDGTTSRYFPMPLVGTSLKDLFAGGPLATTAGRAKWMSLAPDPSLQANCDQEGINQTWPSGGIKLHLRLGIVGNNEMDCDTPDSFIGFGATVGAPGVCFGGTDPMVVVGNAARATCMAPKDKTTRLWGFLFVR
jgi:hypothetical protein